MSVNEPEEQRPERERGSRKDPEQADGTWQAPADIPAPQKNGKPQHLDGFSQVEKEKRDLDRMIQPMLAGGVALASLMMVVGLLLGALRGIPIPHSLPPFGEILPLVESLQPAGWLALGLLVLIATPILRVAGSVIAFLIERDWRYAFITFIVFLIVLSSILLGRE